LQTQLNNIQLTPEPQGPMGPTGAASTVEGPIGPQGATGPAGADVNTTQIITDLSDLQALFSGVMLSATTLRFTGMNLQLVSGSGATDGTVNGLAQLGGWQGPQLPKLRRHAEHRRRGSLQRQWGIS
jgi:hypothetical protein